MKRKNKFSLLLFLAIAITTFVTNTMAYFTSSDNLKNNFKAEDYSINLNGNGGTYVGSSLLIDKNKTTLPIPNRKGYTFIGYSMTSTGIVSHSNEISNVDEINNKTMYAKWDLNTYTITYYLNGGTISGNPSDYNIESETFTLPTPTRSGYTFAGWTGSNGDSPETIVTIPKGTTGDLSFTANWYINTFTVDVNPIIQDETYYAGLATFTFTVYLNDVLVAEDVTDYYNDAITYGSKLRIVVNARDGYTIKSFSDTTWTIIESLTISPEWYDDIAPTITSFTLINLGLHDVNRPQQGYDIYIYVNGYDNGTGIKKYQTWLKPRGNGSGAGREDGEERTLYNVLYLDSAEGRTFCAYAIDNAGNESEKCGTIKVE